MNIAYAYNRFLCFVRLLPRLVLFILFVLVPLFVIALIALEGYGWVLPSCFLLMIWFAVLDGHHYELGQLFEGLTWVEQPALVAAIVFLSAGFLGLWIIAVNPSIYVCLAASILCLLGISLVKNEFVSESRSIIYHVLASLEEMFVVITVVCTVYSAVSLAVNQTIPDDTTLQRLESWESKVRLVFDRLKSLRGHTFVWLALLGASVAARTYLQWKTHLYAAKAVAQAWEWASTARRWLGRCYLAFLVAVSFTFLGATSNAPDVELTGRITMIHEQYTNFRRQLRQEIQRTVERDLLRRAHDIAIVRSPRGMKSSLDYASNLSNINDHIKKEDHARELAGIDPGEPLKTEWDLIAEASSASQQLTLDRNVNDSLAIARDATLLSSRKISQLTAEIQRFSDTRDKEPRPEWMNGLNGELVTNVLKLLMEAPTKKATSFFDHFTIEFPLFGEITSAIGAPLRDFVANKLALAADKMARAALGREFELLGEHIDKVATIAAQETRIDLPEHSEDWDREMSTALESRGEALHNEQIAFDQEIRTALLARLASDEEDLKKLDGAKLAPKHFAKLADEERLKENGFDSLSQLPLQDPKLIDVDSLAMRVDFRESEIAFVVHHWRTSSRALLDHDRFEKFETLWSELPSSERITNPVEAPISGADPDHPYSEPHPMEPHPMIVR
jgi:hypothetical protein